MKLAVISLGKESSQNIGEEAKNYFRDVKMLDLRKVEVHATSKSLNVLYDGEELDHYDSIYIRGSYKYAILQRSITEALHFHTYMPLSPKSFTLGHNKFLTMLHLQEKNVPIPTTYLVETVTGAKKLLEKVNYPIIMKIPSGTQGKGVMFADSIASAKSILDTLEVFKQPYIIQEYVETNATDIRAIVVDSKVVASMRRKALSDELRANIHMGGIGVSCELDEETEEIAIRSAKAIGAEVCAVDILEGNKPMVIEVNLSPGLDGITKATKKNVAKIIAEYLHKKANEFKETRKSDDYSKIISTLDTETDRKEIITNLDIKAGIIKLPKLMTKITGFNQEDEIMIIANKGKLIIKKHIIGREVK